MEKIKKSNIILYLSILFFVFATAFTWTPTEGNTKSNVDISVCWTCTFSNAIDPTGCKLATYCGMTNCDGECDMGGGLCGPDCG